MTHFLDTEKFIELWNSGMSTAEMARVLNCGDSTISDTRKRLGLKPRKPSLPRKTPEQLQRVRDLWVQGKSLEDIASIMGAGFTRNSVVGILYRSKMSRASRDPSVKPAPRIARKAPTKPRAIAAAKPPAPEAAKGLVTGVAFPPMPPKELGQRRATFAAEGKKTIRGMDEASNDNAVPLLERRFGQCAWPVGTPDRPRNQLVCGQPVFEGVEKCSYCLPHANRAFARDVSQPKPKDNLARAVRSWAA